MLDLDTACLRVVSAGHLPPLLRMPEGETRVLEVDGDPPLGIARTAHFREHEFALEPGSTVVLVTDGAVEVRGESVDLGLERLRTLVAETDDAAAACEAIARGDARGLPAEDDVAVLAAHVAPLPERLRTTWPATADALAAMRPLLRRWLTHWGAGDDQVYDITVAVQEASANAVEHAYGPGGATFDVEAACDDGLVTITIRDQGQWRAPRGTHRGRGLPMMRALDGRRRALPRRRRHDGRAAAPAGMTPLAEVRVEWHGDTPVAAVHGEVDASNVGQVATALRARRHEPFDRARHRPHAHALPGQRRHQPAVRVR